MTNQNKRPRRGHGEGAIYWRESRKRWIAELPLENGKSKYFSGKTYAEAKQKLNQAQLEQRQGKLATGPKQTVKDFLHYWFEEGTYHNEYDWKPSRTESCAKEF
jgi:integrase